MHRYLDGLVRLVLLLSMWDSVCFMAIWNGLFLLCCGSSSWSRFKAYSDLFRVYLWSASHCGQCYFVGGQYADHVVSSHDGFCCITDDTGWGIHWILVYAAFLYMPSISEGSTCEVHQMSLLKQYILLFNFTIWFSLQILSISAFPEGLRCSTGLMSFLQVWRAHALQFWDDSGSDGQISQFMGCDDPAFQLVWFLQIEIIGESAGKRPMWGSFDGQYSLLLIIIVDIIP